MQEGKEDSTGFVKNVKKKVYDWWISYGKLWTTRFFEYILLFLLVAFVVRIVFARFNLYHTDADSARYMLSALVQSQAAIIAIVVTLTLVAVQLTASAYSPRVIRIFRDNPDMWILLLFYGVSISYGLLVLKMIQVGDLRQIPLFLHPLEYHIFSAYVAVVFTFFMLFPYMWNIINLLNPANIINRLKIKITKSNILNSEEDPVQPIMDIVHRSIMKYDLETTRAGLKAVTGQMVEIIDSDSQKEIITCFCDHFRQVRMLTVDKMNEEATGEVIKSLETFGRSTAEKNLGYVTQKITRSIELTGELAAKKGECFDASTWQAIESLKLVEKVVMEKGEKFETTAEAIARSLHNVAIAAAENKREWPTICAVLSLEEIGKGAIKHELVRVPRKIVFSLLRVVAITTEKGLENATKQAAESLAELTISSEEIVKTAIQTYELELEEKNRDSFQKFMKIYEQKREKLRAEKR